MAKPLRVIVISQDYGFMSTAHHESSMFGYDNELALVLRWKFSHYLGIQ